MKTFIVGSLLGVLFLSACEKKTETISSNGSTGAAAVGDSTQSKVSTDAAIQQISRNWNEAENWIPRIKSSQKGGTEYDKARSLYDTARSENNSWVELLVTKIKNGSKPEKSEEFKNQSKKSAEATNQFLEYSKSLRPPGASAKPGVAITAVSVVVDLLVTNGFKIWTEYHKQRQADRDRMADDLRKRLTWPTWEK